MADNNVAPNWPVISGEYAVGDPAKQVALVTLGSELDKSKLIKKIALIGTMKTENIGIEKVIANVLSNANIRYLLVCGAEVHGHLAGDAFIAIVKNGVDKAGRIVGAAGAIPYISNIPAEIVDRFRKQVEIINLMNVEDIAQIEKGIDAAAPKPPFPDGQIVITLGGAKEKAVEGVVVVTPELVSIESRVRMIESDVKSLGKMQKLMAGIYSGIYQGALIGFIAVLVISLIRRMLL
jgi:tetrahydromethanopterin S-methyltransferase subunit A